LKPIPHVAASCVIGAAVGVYFGSLKCALVSLAAGVLIDLDHLWDYYATHPVTADIKKIYDACAEVNLNKLYFFLHSYELVILMWCAIYVFSMSNAWKAAAIGLTQHLLFDQLTNPVKPMAYFLTYRIFNRFDPVLLHKEPGKRCPR
jgi:hypothetical protein